MTKTITFFIEADGMKGQSVINRFIEKPYYQNHYEVYVVLDDDMGEAVNTIQALDVPYLVLEDPKNPLRELEEFESSQGYMTDFLVSCGWAFKIPDSTIHHAQIAAINCHSSYLPDYKGLCAYRTLWANAADEGGATIHYLTEEFDEGNIICQEHYPIGLLDTPLDIARRYCDLTSVLLREALHLIEEGYEGKTHSGGRYFPKLSWGKTIRYGLENHLRRLFNIPLNEVEPVKDNE